MIYLCDFEDSFTYNIYADLKESNLPVTVIPFEEVQQFLNIKTNSKTKEIIILGPGPGHPDEYKDIQETLEKLLKRENLLLVGICLGHQLIWQAQGFACHHSATPVHGQVQNIELYDTCIKVQRYNSLSIKLSKNQITDLKKEGWDLVVTNSELDSSSNNNILSYQFHPESVGTTCKNLLYSPINKFLL